VCARGWTGEVPGDVELVAQPRDVRLGQIQQHAIRAASTGTPTGSRELSTVRTAECAAVRAVMTASDTAARSGSVKQKMRVRLPPVTGRRAHRRVALRSRTPGPPTVRVLSVNRCRLVPTATKSAPATGVKFSAVTGASWSLSPPPADLKTGEATGPLPSSYMISLHYFGVVARGSVCPFRPNLCPQHSGPAE
jgi:hypothetical protein